MYVLVCTLLPLFLRVVKIKSTQHILSKLSLKRNTFLDMAWLCHCMMLIIFAFISVRTIFAQLTFFEKQFNVTNHILAKLKVNRFQMLVLLI